MCVFESHEKFVLYFYTNMNMNIYTVSLSIPKFSYIQTHKHINCHLTVAQLKKMLKGMKSFNYMVQDSTVPKASTVSVNYLKILNTVHKN